MVSEKFLINSDSGRMQAAKYVTENFAWYAHLSKQDTLRLCLLVEETLGMVKEMVQDYYGCLWFRTYPSHRSAFYRLLDAELFE